jgi:hypothetical protein
LIRAAFGEPSFELIRSTIKAASEAQGLVTLFRLIRNYFLKKIRIIRLHSKASCAVLTVFRFLFIKNFKYSDHFSRNSTGVGSSALRERLKYH